MRTFPSARTAWIDIRSKIPRSPGVSPPSAKENEVNVPPWKIAKIAAMVESSPAKGRSFPRSAVTSRPLPRAVRSTRGVALSAESAISARSRGDSVENRESVTAVFPFSTSNAPAILRPRISRTRRSVRRRERDEAETCPDTWSAGARRRDRDAHIEVAQDGELHSVAGSRHAALRGSRRPDRRPSRRESDERREALQRIRTRNRLLLFPGRLGSIDRQVRSVHPDCGDAEPAAKQRNEHGRDAHGPDGAMDLSRAGQFQLSESRLRGAGSRRARFVQPSPRGRGPRRRRTRSSSGPARS